MFAIFQVYCLKVFQEIAKKIGKKVVASNYFSTYNTKIAKKK